MDSASLEDAHYIIKDYLDPLDYVERRIVTFKVKFHPTPSHVAEGRSHLTLNINSLTNTARVVDHFTPKCLEDFDCYTRAATLIRALDLTVDY